MWSAVVATARAYAAGKVPGQQTMADDRAADICKNQKQFEKYTRLCALFAAGFAGTDEEALARVGVEAQQ